VFLVLGLALTHWPAQGIAEPVNPQEAATKVTYLVVYRPARRGCMENR
jgi:hypothetical protein